jgi:predicted dithiol-disulfide oxidoreductase (DUF899 family)
VEDFELTTKEGEKVRLSRLFGEKEDLVVVHDMGRSCPTCTTWADGLNGLRAHLEDRLAFVVSTPDEPATQRSFAAERGWSFRMVSTAGTSFADDLGFAGEHEGKRMLYPGLSVFRRAEGGGLVRVARDWFGPGDPYCALWPIMDLLPHGQGDWWPRLNYG